VNAIRLAVNGAVVTQLASSLASQLSYEHKPGKESYAPKYRGSHLLRRSFLLLLCPLCCCFLCSLTARGFDGLPPWFLEGLIKHRLHLLRLHGKSLDLVRRDQPDDKRQSNSGNRTHGFTRYY
jgi:hypothetical protein